MNIFKMASRFGIRPPAIRRQRKDKVSTSPKTEESSPHVKIKQLKTQVSNLEQNLQQSIHTVDSLKAQLAEYDVLLAHAQCRVAEPTPPAFQDETQALSQTSCVMSPKMKSTRVWIDDLWLCNASENTPLQEAEAYWKNGSPQCALEIVTQAIDSNPFLSPSEEFRCRIFVAAVYHSTGQFDESNRLLGIVLKTITRYTHLDEPRPGDLMSIAHYIQGRNLMELGEFTDAYYSLSRALGTPGYHTKARDYQKNAVIEFTRQVAMGDNASISSSLRPIVSRTECISDEYLS
jgi:tetratricopeptide (TPR) repeat protein